MARQALALKAYQDSTVERMVAQDRLAVLADPGLGKTVMALEAFRRLRSWCDVDGLLIVAPKRVCYSVWPAEVAKWEPFRGLRVKILHGAGRRADNLYGADVYVINPEGLKWLRRQTWRWPEMLVVDESTRFKRASSQRSSHLAAILHRFARRYILTGTPAPNGLENLHGQFKILDGGAALFEEVGDFRERWEVMVPTGSLQYRRWRLRRGAKEEIYQRVAPLCVRLDAKDHLDLPELVNVTVPVQLPPDARELYDRLRKDMVLRLKEGTVAAVNAGVVTAKCRQIANGPVYLTEGSAPLSERIAAGPQRQTALIHDAKVEALLGLVEELQGKPLLVAYEHDHERLLIQERLKPLVGKVPYIGGSVSGPAGAKIERAWNAGDVPVLLVQPQSASLGLNLQQGGHHLCWFALTWDLEAYDQQIRRLLRQGQTAAHVLVYHLVAERTVDLLIMRALERKDGEQRDFLDFLREDLTGAAPPPPPPAAEPGAAWWQD